MGELFCPMGFCGPSSVGWVKLRAVTKFHRVGHKDTSFRKFNLIFFYKKIDSKF